MISIPFVISGAFADIVEYKVNGQDGFENTVSQTDQIEIEMEVSSEVTADDVAFEIAGKTHRFSSCENINEEATICRYKSALLEREGGAYNYKLMELSFGSPVDTIQKTLVVDSSPPVFSAAAITVESGEIRASFDAMDQACRTCGSLCSNIAMVNLVQDGTILRSFIPETESCRYTIVKKFSLSELSLPEGENEVCLIAYDILGQGSKPVCKEIYFDSSKPRITGIRVTDDEGNPVTHVSNRSKKVNVAVNISENRLAGAKADLSSFNAFIPESLKDLEGECRHVRRGMYSCIWEGIGLHAASGSLNAIFTMADDNGNVAEETRTVTMGTDFSSPKPMKTYNYYGGPADDDVLYLHPGENTIAVRFDETGSGFYRDEAYLDMESLNSESRVKADRCYNEGASWVCLWNTDVMKSDGARGQVYLSLATADDAGNNVDTVFSWNFAVSSSQPKVVEMSINPECPTTMDDAKTMIKIDHEHDVNVVMDASNVADLEPAEMECSREDENLIICEYTIVTIDSFAHVDDIYFNITDRAGNSVVAKKPTSVCEPDLTVVPNFLTIKTGSLPKIDARTLSFTSYPVSVPIIHEMKAGAKIVNKEISCTNSQRAYFIGDLQSLNFIALLDKQSVKNASEGIVIECEMKVRSRRGIRSYMNPEVENINITFQTFNNPLGTIGENYQTTIDSIENDINDIQDSIEKWQKWNKWMSMICSIVEMIASINAILGIVKAVLFALYNALKNVPIIGGIVRAIWNAACPALSWVDKMVVEFVWPPAYAVNFGGVIKVVCMIYSCKICTLDYAEAWADLTGVDPMIMGFVAGGVLGGYSGGLEAALSGGGLKGVIKGATPTLGWHTAASAASGGVRLLEGDGKPTQIGNFLGSKMDPSKSIHAAKSCLCVPGIIYNMKKERQIKCMLKKCVEENAEVGLPLTTCYTSYKERQCLYVEGAQWKLVGSNFFFQFLANIGSMLFRNIPIIMASIGWHSTCGMAYYKGKYANDCPESMNPVHNVGCHLYGSVLTISEVGDILDVELDKYNPPLKGTNYCSSSG